MPDFSKAEVGDRVFGIQGGPVDENGHNGTIMKIVATEDDFFPIEVVFSNNEYETYTKRGERDKTDGYPSLFWSKPDFNDPPAPKRMVKKEVWMNMYKSVCYGYYSETQANGLIDKDTVVLQTKVEIEVPEDLF